MLHLIRRHTADCPHRPKGVKHLRCSCPIHIHGIHNGKRIRVAADTADLDTANRRKRRIEDGEPVVTKPDTTVGQAVTAFLTHRCRDLDDKTARKYRNTLRKLECFASSRHLVALRDVSVTHIDEFGAERRRTLSPLSWSKDLQRLRAFFGWCAKRDYTKANPASDVEMPRNPRGKDVVPYIEKDIIAILAACDMFGRGPYERLRAKAMIEIMRFTGLAISDTAMLKRSQVEDGRIRLDRKKTGKPICVSVPSVVTDALANLPEPIGSPKGGSPYFFWNGVMSARALIGTAERTMAAVFKQSGVANAGTHRFRHTLATRMLEEGATFEDVAAILGNSPRVVEKHYAKWSRAREDRLNSILARLHPDTTLTRDRLTGAKSFSLNEKKWCGEGDLNPHALSSASTSS